MFTGIVEEVGAVEQVRRGSSSAVLHIRAALVPAGLKPGDSVAVNGVCLTAVDVRSDGFAADVMHETLDRSALAALKPGSHVNLERAMPADGRFGGHIVAGHVDGVGTIADVRGDDNAVWYTVRAEARVLRYVVEKGSVAIDGISLTVARVSADRFSISAIPHTAAVTTLGERRTGDRVNLECDVIGKYVERFLQPPPSGGITKDFLTKYGF